MVHLSLTTDEAYILSYMILNAPQRGQTEQPYILLRILVKIFDTVTSPPEKRIIERNMREFAKKYEIEYLLPKKRGRPSSGKTD